MKNHKVLIAIILSVVTLSLFAQTEPVCVNDNGFNSVFQDLKTGSFSGNINSVLIVKDAQNIPLWFFIC
ncbi:hypothetical protein [Lacinutrix undariae]